MPSGRIVSSKCRSRVLDLPGVAVLPLGENARIPALALLQELAEAGIPARAEVTGRSMKASLKWASKMKAAVALILGETELEEERVVLRDLREGSQESVGRAEVLDRLREMLDR